MSSGLELIVNADDFGFSEAVNRGIVDAHDHGIVTSASLMATGAAFEHAVELARSRPRLAVGVHLVLTEHRPLMGAAAPSLVDGRGAFEPHLAQLLGRQLRRGISLSEVRRELAAQIERVRGAGISISHLDGHQHVHVLPGIARVVAELAAAYGIGAVRYPAERVRGYMLRSARHGIRLAEQAALGLFCAASPLERLRRSDEFVGFYFGGRLDEAHLATVITGLPAAGTVELMCHPGDEGMQPSGDWQYAWAKERDALMSPRIRELVMARGVQLVAKGSA
jgi:hopanoid biosynthesis associated protein HpnK